MSLKVRLMAENAGKNFKWGDIPTSSIVSENNKLVGMRRKHASGLLPSWEPFSSSSGDEYLDLSLQTQAFGPLPIGNGVAVRNDVIQTDVNALEGDLDLGVI